MSSSMLSVTFEYEDGNTKNYTLGTFSVSSQAVSGFKSRLKTFDTVEPSSNKKYTNLATVLKSEDGAKLVGVKAASITTSEVRRIFDASTYGG